VAAIAIASSGARITYADEPRDPAAQITIVAVGDVMFGRYRAGGGRDAIPADRRDLFGAVAPAIRAADFAIANLETPILRRPPHRCPAGTPRPRRRFVATPAQVATLARAGFDAVVLANNHADDMGDAGTTETGAVLGELGLRDVGRARAAGDDRPAIRVETVDVRGWRVGVIAATTVRNRSQRPGAPVLPFAAPDRVAADVIAAIAAARPDHDAIVVSLHWGIEGAHRPSPWQVDAARAIVDAGADAVIGHHPHVVQPIERYRGAVIAYSLGNFLFDNTGARARRGGVLELTLRRGSRGAVARFVPTTLTPRYRIILEPPAQAVREPRGDLAVPR
jgi:poly-gamma-glutamate synthesis protein (capsule biosynthesis protein)